MATVERFEDLRCWQTGRQLTDLVYKYSEDGAVANDFSLKDQIRRASISIMSNINVRESAVQYEVDDDHIHVRDLAPEPFRQNNPPA